MRLGQQAVAVLEVEVDYSLVEERELKNKGKKGNYIRQKVDELVNDVAHADAAAGPWTHNSAGSPQFASVPSGRTVRARTPGNKTPTL